MATSRLCSMPDCGKPHEAKSYCRSHYARFRRHGDPSKGGTANGEPQLWVNSHMHYTGDDCILWPFARGAGGDAIIVIDGIHASASRYMCKLANGEPSDATLETAHSCGNGHLGCMTKRHLRWDTHSGNMADKVIHGTTNRGERHGNSKLTRSDVIAIRKLLNTQMASETALSFGVNRSVIAKIKAGHLWGWL